MSESNVCEECGFALDSQEHIRGVGLHGHTRTSDAVADRQRADVMKRAHDFAAGSYREEVKAAYEAEFGPVPTTGKGSK